MDVIPSRVPATLKSMSPDRKSTRLNSSHSQISYAVFCLKKKTNREPLPAQISISLTILAQPQAPLTNAVSHAPSCRHASFSVKVESNGHANVTCRNHHV